MGYEVTMKNPTDQLCCDIHGSAPATYLCVHLADNPVQRWHCTYPSEDNPWPDAWCNSCQKLYLREGEWNDKNEGEAELSILCSHCYEQKLGESVRRLNDNAQATWRSFVEERQRELRLKQEELSGRYSMGLHKRWDWDQERGEIIFSNDGIAALIAKVTFVGSVSSKSATWLWSWANKHVLEVARDRIIKVRDLGEKRDFPHWVVPRWAATEVDGWQMAAVAAHVLGADGAYRTPGDTGFTFMTLSEVRHAQ